MDRTAQIRAAVEECLRDRARQGGGWVYILRASAVRVMESDFAKKEVSGKLIRAGFAPLVSGEEEDEPRLLAVVQDLAAEGMLVAGPSFWQHTDVRLTEEAVQVLTADAPSPHEDGYLQRIREIVGAEDGVVLGYVEDAVACFRRRVYRAAVVLVGLATEHEVRELAQGVCAAYPNRFPDLTPRLNDIRLTEVFDQLKVALKELVGDDKARLQDLGRDHRFCNAGFDILWRYRNEGAHPGRFGITQDEAEVALKLFPSFCEYIREWRRYMDERRNTDAA